MNATCDGSTPPGTRELSQSFYDFFGNFSGGSTPAIFFNTTNVETGERMFVTNLLPHNPSFDTLPALFDVNKTFNLPFSSAACLSGRFPIITPAGFVTADDRKFRYVDGHRHGLQHSDVAARRRAQSLRHIDSDALQG